MASHWQCSTTKNKVFGKTQYLDLRLVPTCPWNSVSSERYQRSRGSQGVGCKIGVRVSKPRRLRGQEHQLQKLADCQLMLTWHSDTRRTPCSIAQAGVGNTICVSSPIKGGSSAPPPAYFRSTWSACVNLVADSHRSAWIRPAARLAHWTKRTGLDNPSLKRAHCLPLQ
jgi:hypothetical protein